MGPRRLLMPDSSVTNSSVEGTRTVVYLKGSAEYGRWVDQLERDTRIPRVTMVDLALAEWAQRKGFPAPPLRL
jgi:hypothetical protein